MNTAIIVVAGALLAVAVAQTALVLRLHRARAHTPADAPDKLDDLLGKVQDLERRLDKQIARADVKRSEISTLQTETRRQVEVLLNLHALFTPRSTMPSTQGWAATPMTIQELVRLVLEHKPDLIVECGSGGSSVWLGYALERVGHGRCVALEHDPEYAARTRADLERHGLTHLVEVRDAPLVPVTIEDDDFSWYDPTQIKDLDGIGLVFVDGPPGASGPLARFPALPMLRDGCAADALFVVDDAGRPDEKRLIERWTDDYAATVVDNERTDTGWCALRLAAPAVTSFPAPRAENRDIPTVSAS